MEYEEPYAAAGWWRSAPLTDDVPSYCKNRSPEYSLSCPYFVPCEPEEACLANNTCSEPYDGYRCSECAENYRKLGGKCEECPDNLWLIIIMFIVAIIGLVLLAYILNSKGVNLALLTIGMSWFHCFLVFFSPNCATLPLSPMLNRVISLRVGLRVLISAYAPPPLTHLLCSAGIDYFQVLAMLRNSRVEWPAALRQLMNLLSVFNLNLDLVGMECVYKTPYSLKWTIIELLPIGSVIVLSLGYLIVYLHKRIKRVPSEKRHSHLDPMIGVFIVLMYYLYLFLTRNTFDMFNCSPTEPDDGYPHGYLEVVFEPCLQKGGLHLRLLPWAIVSLLVYIIAYPIVVTVILIRNKEKLKVDQYLRAYNIGDTPQTNKYLGFRRRYHKLYYMFKPGKGYWIIVIFARKLLIAVTGLMFRRTPAFQLSFALLVLFIAYALQMKNLPYMSMSERLSVIYQHEKKVSEEDKLHVTLNQEIVRSLAEAHRRKDAYKSAEMDRIKERHQNTQPVFFLDYNLVESVLLFCAVLVCLGGVMFESQKFDSSASSGAREALAVIIVLIVSLSIAYYLFVFVMEMVRMLCVKRLAAQKNPNCCVRFIVGKKKKTSSEIEGERQRLAAQNDEAGLSMNPMLMRGQDFDESMTQEVKEKLSKSAPPQLSEWTAVKQYVKSLETQVDDMTKDYAHLKKQESQMTTVSKFAYAKKKPAAAGRKRNQFKQVLARRNSTVDP